MDTDNIMSKLDVDWHYREEIPEQMILNYRMVDFYLAQLKLQGFYILGSLFWEFTPDAIVLPSWKKHKKMTLNLTCPFGEVNFVLSEDLKIFESITLNCLFEEFRSHFIFVNGR